MCLPMLALASTSILTSPPLHHPLCVRSDSPFFFLPAVSLGVPVLLLTQPLFSLSRSLFPTFYTSLSLWSFIFCLWPKSQSPHSQSPLSITEMCPPQRGLHLLSWSHPSGTEGRGHRQGVWASERGAARVGGGAKRGILLFLLCSPISKVGIFFLLPSHLSSFVPSQISLRN